MAAAQYSYIGLAGEVIVIAAGSFIDQGAWSGSTSYAVRDVVLYNSRLFICVAAHTGVTPPLSFVITIPEYWSPLVLIEGGSAESATAQDAYNLAQSALEMAWAGTDAAAVALGVAIAGTNAADQAYDLATLALNTAWAGTDAAAAAQSTADNALAIAIAGTNGVDATWAYAGQAWTIAVTGTTAADQAYALAQLALTTAWTGTGASADTAEAHAVAHLALETAWVGTNAADQAYALAQLALETAWAGTNQPALDSVHTIAVTALNTAWSGTDAANSADMWGRTAYSLAVSGTIAADSAYALAQQALDAALSGTGSAASYSSVYALAVAGTNAANQADSLAQQALAAAWAGTSASVAKSGDTMTGNLVVPNVQVSVGTVAMSSATSGTIYYDLAGPAYQETTVDDNLCVSAQNMGAGREIAVILRNNGTTHALTYAEPFVWLATEPPASIVNTDIVIAMTSTGNTLGSVLSAAQPTV